MRERREAESSGGSARTWRPGRRCPALWLSLPLLVGSLLAADLAAAQPSRIYIANDDHTDYIWSASESEYRAAFVRMLDYYLDQADRTAATSSDLQGRFNADGSFWLWAYERDKSPAEFQRLIARIRDGHITVPLQPLVLLYGTMPAEAVIRSMYYPGRIERRENLRFELASDMENATQCYGLASLLAGAGAKYGWKGVCGCATSVTGLDDRGREIYWALGPDGRRILMKWHSLSDTWPELNSPNQSSGGYAEAFDSRHAVDFATTDSLFLARYPYPPIVGLFGKGWDLFETETDDVVRIATAMSDASRRVIVSNELDFFRDFEVNAPAGSIPSFSGGFGLEWDVATASLAEVSATVKRSVEKLRPAEALATLVELARPSVMRGREALRDSALMYLGLYYEHDIMEPYVLNATERAAFERRCAAAVQTYVDGLQQDALAALGSLVRGGTAGSRFLVFNPLGWTRTDVADLPVTPAGPCKVVDITSGSEVRSQTVTQGGRQSVRILAADVPPMGYRVYELQAGASAFADSAARFSAGGTTFENDKYRVTLTSRGAISSLIDKRRGAAEWAQPIGGRVLNDLGAGSGPIAAENVGPVSATILVDASGSPPHRTRVTLYDMIDRVDIDDEITGNFGNRLTSYAFGFKISGYTVRHEEVGAIATAKYIDEGGSYSPTHCRYDWFTMNHFVDLSDASRGITLSNWDSQVFALGGSSGETIDETTPVVKAFAGGKLGTFGFDDQEGDTYFRNRYALRAHDAYDQAAAMRFALEHQNPLVAGPVTGSGSSEPYPEATFSFLSLADSNVILWAVKPAEEGIGDGVILRLWNVDPVPRTADVRFHSGAVVQDVRRTSHIETDSFTSTGVKEGSVLAAGTTSLLDPLPPQRMQTYRVRLQLPVSVPDPTTPGGGPPAIDRLGQNQPNPFNPRTTIAFALASRGRTVLTLYDLRGRTVARLIDGVLEAGPHTAALDAAALRLPSGVYLYRLKTPRGAQSRLMTLVK